MIKMKFKRMKNNQKNDKKKGQIFLVCTIIIIIYMLSFIGVIYELNAYQYTQAIEMEKFQSTYENFETETNNFVLALTANATQPGTIITSNAVAAQFLQDWLDFAEKEIITKGYAAFFDIDELSPTLPVEIVNVNTRVGFRANIDVYMKSNYMTIDTQFSYNFNYIISYVNTATNARITFRFENQFGVKYIGYAIVTVNNLATTDWNNGTYIYSSPLVAGNIIRAISLEQIRVRYTV